MMVKSVCILVVLSALLVCFFQINVKAQENVIVVPDDFVSIQGAVDAACDGDTVFVKGGTYNESVWVDRSISLVGEGAAATTIVGDFRLNGTVVLVTADNVVVSGFCVRSSGYSYARKGIHLLHVRYCTVVGNTVLNTQKGIWLYGSSDNNITGNVVSGTEANNFGMSVVLSSSNLIFGNVVSEHRFGIYLGESGGNVLFNNSVLNNHEKGLMIRSNSNNISDNVVSGNRVGLSLYGVNNIFKENKFSNNDFCMDLEWGSNWSVSDFVNDIDSSNTVDGVAMVYWIDVQDEKVPEESQFVVLINCTNITVENLETSKNRQGIILAFTSNSTVQKNSMYGMHGGIIVYCSSNNQISNNLIVDDGIAIQLVCSFQNKIDGNSLEENSSAITMKKSDENTIEANIISKDNSHGIRLDASNNNQFFNNTIIECSWTALWFWNNASDNLFYLNNFIDNHMNIELYVTDFQEFPQNIWDNGTIGNYWSDYNWVDSNEDGIGDYPYEIDENNKDHYPLMEQTVIPEFSSGFVLLFFVGLSSVAVLWRKRGIK